MTGKRKAAPRVATTGSGGEAMRCECAALLCLWRHYTAPRTVPQGGTFCESVF